VFKAKETLENNRERMRERERERERMREKERELYTGNFHTGKRYNVAIQHISCSNSF
jgi:hypothetical protein